MDKKNYLKYVVGISLMLTLLLAVSCKEAPPEPESLYLTYSGEAVAGDEFSVQVMAHKITNVYGFQFDLLYNAEALELVSMEKGAALTAFGHPDNVFCIGENTETAGLIKNVACTRTGKIGNAELNGVVYELSFKALSQGTTELSFSNVKALDSELNEVTVKTEKLQVTVR